MLGLNQRHPPCHDGALPTELIEHSLFKEGHFTHQAIYLEAVLLQKKNPPKRIFSRN